jgi:hypothetical protein
VAVASQRSSQTLSSLVRVVATHSCSRASTDLA